jgi:hypothetical protein
VGLSETIVAAIIGASATVSAAGFQWMRAARAPSAAKPRRSALRAALSLVALVVASAFGGFAWSELRAQGAREEIARLRAEMNDQMQALVTANERLAATRAAHPEIMASEALVQLAPCARSLAEGAGPAPLCEAGVVAPVTLCTRIPATAERLGIEHYSRPLDDAGEWRPHLAAGDDRTFDVSFVDATPAQVAEPGLVPVCVAVRSEDPEHTQVARLVVRYRTVQADSPPAIAAR